MKPGHPSRLRGSHGSLLLRQRVHHPVDQARDARRALLGLPSLLHRQAEAGRHRWPGRAVPAAPGACRLRLLAAPGLTGAHCAGDLPTMIPMVVIHERRRPGRPGRRDDAHPVLVVGVGAPRRRRGGDGVQPVTSVAARRRWLRLPVIRGIVALGESLVIGFRALAISAHYAAVDDGEATGEAPTAGLIARPADLRLRGRIGFTVIVFKVSPALITDFIGIDSTGWFVIVEGAIRVGSCRLPGADRADPRPAARIPVPRRRAQGDQRLRGRREADAGDRAGLLEDPRALRHGLPAVGDGDRRVRVRGRRPAGLAGADRLARRAAAGDRRASPTR